MSENNIENNGGAPEAPKKKNIVHVFRPQNTQNAKMPLTQLTALIFLL